MKTREQIKESYHKEAESLQAKIASLKAKSRAFVTGEIVSFLGIIFFIVLITISDATLAKTIEGLLSVASFALYVVIRNRDVKNSERMAETERLCKAYQHEEAYLDGDFSSFDDGQRYVNPNHPFTFDLDIFGKESLYQRINRTVTTGGAERLAENLSLTGLTPTGLTPAPLQRRGGDYYQELEGKSLDGHTSPSPLERGRGEAQSRGEASEPQTSSWRLYFISCGIDGKIDTDAILKSLPELRKVAIPAWLGGKGIKVLIWALIIGLLASIVAAVYGFVNPMLPILWIFVNFFVVQGIANKYLKAMQTLGVKLHNQMQPLMRLIKHVVNEEAAYSEKLKEAEASFESLTNIVDTLVLRGNDVYRFFADAFGLRGLVLVSKFYHWRNMASDNLPEWIDTIAEIDADVSKAQFNYNHQSETCKATIVEDSHVVYEAKGLYHPFLGEKAVRNDFSIKDRNFYIITGANMAGKSTFLRAIGVNYILAMNGMPVFADSLTVSRFKLFTSMRTSDDLAHGISYFNAELLRLKQLIESLPPAPSKGGGEGVPLNTKGANDVAFPPPLEGGRGRLIILDEILKGTNSLDKLNGSRMFLRAMEDKPVTGVIATHDLELSKMDEESSRFHNYCFEIKLGTDVTYSYKITPGVARNQNATFLLKQLLNGESVNSGRCNK